MQKTDKEKAEIDLFLGSMGLGTIRNPETAREVGFMIALKINQGSEQDRHDALRRWLNECDNPQDRRDMYEVVKPYMLGFTPKPLDVYEAEIGMEAVAKQLPIWEDGKFRAYNTPEIGDARPMTQGEAYEQFGILPNGALPSELASLASEKGYCRIHDMRMFGACPICAKTNPAADASAIQDANKALSGSELKAKVWVVCARCTKEDVFQGWCKQDAVEKMRWWGWKLDPVTGKELCEKCAK